MSRKYGKVISRERDFSLPLRCDQSLLEAQFNYPLNALLEELPPIWTLCPLQYPNLNRKNQICSRSEQTNLRTLTSERHHECPGNSNTV